MLTARSAAQNNQTQEGVAIKKVTNVFSKKILAKRALREIKLLQHFRGKSARASLERHQPLTQLQATGTYVRSTAGRTEQY